MVEIKIKEKLLQPPREKKIDWLPVKLVYGR